MDNLFADLDRDVISSFTQVRNSGFTTPKKPRQAATLNSTDATATQTPSVIEAADVAATLEGAENWDWSEFDADIPSPKKTPVKPTKVRRRCRF